MASIRMQARAIYHGLLSWVHKAGQKRVWALIAAAATTGAATQALARPHDGPRLTASANIFSSKGEKRRTLPSEKCPEVYCLRTLNLGPIKAIAYDADNTLVQYNVKKMQKLAFDFLKQEIIGRLGWPIENLAFDDRLVVQGAVLDIPNGNLLKLDRSGYVWKAFHGIRPMSFERTRDTYPATIDMKALDTPRFAFLNSLYSMSRGAMFAQLVTELDERDLNGALTYEDLAAYTRELTNNCHRQGKMKEHILENSDEFLVQDAGVVPMLEAQRRAKKKVLLVTNSDFKYADAVLQKVLSPFIKGSGNPGFDASAAWQSLFDVIVVRANKPDFFVRDNGNHTRAPFAPHEVVEGSSAAEIERRLGLALDDILYVGDHPWDDIHASKERRWRTILIFSAIEQERAAWKAFRPDQEELKSWMSKRRQALQQQAMLLTARDEVAKGSKAYGRYTRRIRKLKLELDEIKAKIIPLLEKANQMGDSYFGLATRAGLNESLLGSLIHQGGADAYTSRVSNLRWVTPYGVLQPDIAHLPHDPQ